jgi:glutathionyl-hydroquinone reductase
MSRDVSSQSDINVMKVEGDGSFKRAPSSFRNFIQKGGQFPPEKGTSVITLFFCSGSKLQS